MKPVKAKTKARIKALEKRVFAIELRLDAAGVPRQGMVLEINEEQARDDEPDKLASPMGQDVKF